MAGIFQQQPFQGVNRGTMQSSINSAMNDQGGDITSLMRQVNSGNSMAQAGLMTPPSPQGMPVAYGMPQQQLGVTMPQTPFGAVSAGGRK